MPALDANDRAACEELACPPGSVFSLVRRFLEDNEADRALALEALFRSIREVPLRVTDPGVATAKLGWWLSELESIDMGLSQHPVVRAVQVAAALKHGESPNWSAYIAAVSAQVVDPSLADLNALENSLREIGGQEALLIAGVQEDHAARHALDLVGMASQLQDLVAGLASEQQEPSWLPWDLKSGLQSDKPGEGDGTGRLAAVITLLSREGLRYLDTAGQEWQGQVGAQGRGHLAIRSAAVRQRLLNMSKRPARVLNQGARQGSLMEVFAVWNEARRVRRLT